MDNPKYAATKDQPGGQLVVSSQNRGEDQIINPVMAYLLRLESPRSRVVMRSTLDCVAALLGVQGCENVEWNAIRRNHVQMLMYQLSQQGLAPSTRNRYLSAIKGVAQEAWLGGGMSAESFQRIKAVKGVKGTRLANHGREIRPDEIKNLLSPVGDRATSLIGVRDRAMIALLLTSGIRKDELRSIKTENLYLDELYFTVIRKGNKEAKVFMQPAAVAFIRHWLQQKQANTEHLFNPISKGGRTQPRQLSSTGVTHILQRAAVELDVEPFAPHDTRRTFATKMFAAGVDAFKIQEMLGHASIKTTMIYNLVDENLVRDALVSVDLVGNAAP